MSVTFTSVGPYQIGNTETLTLPSGSVAGDLLLVNVLVFGTASPPTFSTGGWTLLLVTNPNVDLYVYTYSVIVTSAMHTAGNAGVLTNPDNSFVDAGTTVNVKGAGGGVIEAEAASIGSGTASSAGVAVGAQLTAAGVTAPAGGTLVMTFWDWGASGGNSGTALSPVSPNEVAHLSGAGTATDPVVIFDADSPSIGPFSPGQAQINASDAPNGAGMAWDGGVAHTILLAASSAPAAPTDIDPTNGSYQDVSSGYDFKSKFNSTDGADQNAYAMRIKVAGGSYQYWNATTNALQGTIVWNACSVAPGDVLTVSIPSSAISNGNVYNWSMASQEASANLQGSFATDSTFTAQVGPGLAITLPGAIVTTSEPIVAWTPTPGPGSVQTSARVVVFSAAQFGIGGFDPSTSPNTWDSGDVAGNGTSISVGTPLANGGSYRAYVQITETGGQTSSWLYVEFTVNFDSPAGATVADEPVNHPVTGQPVIELDVAEADNLLSAVDASLETGIGTWVSRSGCTVAQSTDQALDGSHSLKMTSTGTGTMKAGTATGTGGYPVVALKSYSALLSFRSAVTAYSVAVDVEWYDATGTLLSTSSGTATADSTTGWTARVEGFNAPMGAAFAAIVAEVRSTATGKSTYVDCAGIFPGTVTTWTAGGFAGSAMAVILRSDGVYVREASPSSPASIPSGEILTVYDYEAIPGVEYTYTVQTSVDLGGGTTVTSAASAPSSEAACETGGRFWLFDPLDPSTAFGIVRAPAQATFSGGGAASLQLDANESMGAFDTAGSDVYTVVHGDQLDEEFDLVITFPTSADWQKFDALRKRKAVVCIKSDMESAMYYISFGSARPRVIMRSGDRTTQTVSQVTVHCYPVGAP